MIEDNLNADSTVDGRIETLMKHEFVKINKVSSFDKMPEIVPLNNQIHFFKDGIEAVVSKSPHSTDLEQYGVVLVDISRSLIIEYDYFGKDYKEYTPKEV